MRTEHAEAPPSFGSALAAAREAMSLSIEDIAARLRMHPRQVVAIEREDLTALPAPAYVRGFIRNYAKEVRIDAAPLVESLNRRIAPTKPPEEVAIAATALTRVDGRSALSRVIVIGVAVAALLLFAGLGWFATHERQSTPEAVSETPIEPDANKAQEAPPAGSKDPSEQTSAGTPALAASTAATVVATTTPAAGEGALQLRFRETSWVEVKQSDGKVIHSQTHPAGAEATVQGKLPLSVVIGNASGVSLNFKNEPVDLMKSAGTSNVARLTLK
jgi:cytoskeleton protein RodZ